MTAALPKRAYLSQQPPKPAHERVPAWRSDPSPTPMSRPSWRSTRSPSGRSARSTTTGLAQLRADAACVLVCEVDDDSCRLRRSPTHLGRRTTRSTTPGTPSASTTSSTSTGSRSRRRIPQAGIATALYDEMEQRATPHGRMVCEINSDPPNVESLAFHERTRLSRDRSPHAARRPRDGDAGEAAVTPDALADDLARRCADVMWADDDGVTATGYDARPGRARQRHAVDDDPRRHDQRARHRARRVHLRPRRLRVRLRLQLLQRAHGRAGLRHRVRRTRQARATGSWRRQSSGTGSAATASTTSASPATEAGADDVIAEFRGRSRTIGGAFVDVTTSEG